MVSRALPCFRLVKGTVYCPMKSFLVDMSKSSTTNRTRASAGISMSNVNSSSHFGLKPKQHRQGRRLELLTNKEGGRDVYKQEVLRILLPVFMNTPGINKSFSLGCSLLTSALHLQKGAELSFAPKALTGWHMHLSLPLDQQKHFTNPDQSQNHRTP